MTKRNVCPRCGAPVEEVNTLVTYIAKLTEEDGEVVVDQIEEQIDVKYVGEPTYYCTACDHEFEEFKVIEEEE